MHIHKMTILTFATVSENFCIFGSIVVCSFIRGKSIIGGWGYRERYVRDKNECYFNQYPETNVYFEGD